MSRTIKGSDGAVALTKNPLAFRKWMMAGPEQAIARLLIEFEREFMPEASGHANQILSSIGHHRQDISSIHETIKKNSLPICSKPTLKVSRTNFNAKARC